MAVKQHLSVIFLVFASLLVCSFFVSTPNSIEDARNMRGRELRERRELSQQENATPTHPILIFFKKGSFSNNAFETADKFCDGKNANFDFWGGEEQKCKAKGSSMAFVSASLSDDEINRLSEADGFDFYEVDEEIVHPVIAFDGHADHEGEHATTASWGLDRIDQRSPELDGLYDLGIADGRDVNVYVMSTGIYFQHEEFEGRAHPALESLSSIPRPCDNDDWTCSHDTLGFGTTVAGTIGSHSFGVAPGVSLHSVKTFSDDAKSHISWFVLAMDWIVTNAAGPSVVATSFSRLYVGESEKIAIENVVAYNIAVIVPAGNSNADACGFSPASVPAAITVAASNMMDARDPSSNFGSCVDIFAPGTEIMTTELFSSTGTYSSVSLAAAHVAGAAALYLQHDHSLTPLSIMEHMYSDSTDAIDSTPSSLLYVGNLKITTTTTTLPYWTVTSGSCNIDEYNCLTNPSFPDHSQVVEECTVQVDESRFGGEGNGLWVYAFSMEEKENQFLSVNGNAYHGGYRENAHELNNMVPEGVITYTSDGTGGIDGFKICPHTTTTTTIIEESSYWKVLSGNCTIYGLPNCIASPNYPRRYTKNETCVFQAVGRGRLETPILSTDGPSDYLHLESTGRNYSGDCCGAAASLGNERIWGRVTWSTDGDDVHSMGFRVCTVLHSN